MCQNHPLPGDAAAIKPFLQKKKKTNNLSEKKLDLEMVFAKINGSYQIIDLAMVNVYYICDQICRMFQKL